MMSRNSSSNYEEMKRRMAKSFIRHDPETMIRNFRLDNDGQYMYIDFVARRYRIDRASGKIEWSEDGFQTCRDAGYNEAMTIYDVLCCPSPADARTEEWVNLNSLSAIMGGNLAVKKDFFQSTADFFRGKTETLSAVCEAMGGKRLPGGDAAYELHLFWFLPLILRFWEADDEFPPSLQIMLPGNILDFMHYETLMFAVSHLSEYLIENAKRLQAI